MKWYFPSWTGDFRLRPNSKHPDETDLLISDPTLDEARLLNELGKTLVEKEWITRWKAVRPGMLFARKTLIRAPLEKVGPLFLSVFKPGPAVLTAVQYASGKILTASGGPTEITELGEKLLEEAKKEPEKPPPTAAVTVKRPTPSCPDCVPGSVQMASEVLLAFLSEEEHESWARDRVLYVEGGLSGHLYRIAHRRSKLAHKQTRICVDLDLDSVVHFHDWTVPPEEEVLAAKLILQHREPWLRNEATMFGVPHTPRSMIFKNPFGDSQDGVPDANLSRAFGVLAKAGMPP